MYRLNLYPEYVEKRRLARLRALRLAVVIALLCAELLLICFSALSGVLLREQARDLQASIERLTARVQAESKPRPELDLAEALLKVRLTRTDWSPKLAALSSDVPPSLLLTEISGGASDAKTAAFLKLEGGFRSGRAPLEAVTGFIEALRRDPRIAREFPDINLGSIQGEEASQFEVVCGPGGGGS